MCLMFLVSGFYMVGITDSCAQQRDRTSRQVKRFIISVRVPNMTSYRGHGWAAEVVSDNNIGEGK